MKSAARWRAILLALNYFFEPLRYNPTLFDPVSDFLGQVDEIHLEGEDGESGNQVVVKVVDIPSTGSGHRFGNDTNKLMEVEGK